MNFFAFCKQLIDRRLAIWRKWASENGGRFDEWLVQQEMHRMQIGQLV